MRGPRAWPALLGGVALALLLSPFTMASLVGEGVTAGFSVRRWSFFLVIAAMSIVLNLILAVGFWFRGWRPLAWGMLVGIVLPFLLLLR